LLNVHIQNNPLPYVDRLAQRPAEMPDLVVIHCTELPDLETARAYGERVHYPESATGNSGHFYIDQNGSVEQWVPIDRIAHHVRGFNERGIGIELVNKGRYPDWLDSRCQEMTEPYPAPQIESLISLLNFLELETAGLESICSHEYLDQTRVPATDNPGLLVCRKLDPGPMFPWTEVLSRTKLHQFS
jgi:N-acetylmuramoyl-L-alanine amidase